MMHYFKFIIILSFVITLFGCEKNKQEKAEQELSYFIDLDKQLKKEIPFSNVFENMQIIPLETNRECMIRRVQKVEMFNNKLFVFDKVQSALLIFDNQGKFIKKIQDVGRGPEEYSEITDFNINKKLGQIELLSPFGIIIYYDMDGNFIKKQKVNIEERIVHYFTNLSDDLVCFYSLFYDTKIAIYSKSQNKVLYETLKKPSEIEATTLMPGCSPFFYNGETNLFFDELDRQVSAPTKEGLIKVRKLDFGKYNLKRKDLRLINSNDDVTKRQKQIISNLYPKYVSIFPFYLENKDFIIASFGFKERYTQFILNKKTKKETVFNTFNNNIRFPFIPINLYNDTLVTVIEPSLLYHLIPKNDSGHNYNLLKNIKLEDNPVSIIYKLKSTNDKE